MSRLDELKETSEKINAEMRFLRREHLSNQQDCATPGGAIGMTTCREKTPEEVIEELFTYHPPEDTETALRYTTVRDAAKHLALVIWKTVPYGSDRTAAIRKLREAVMTANAAIALKGLNV